MSLDVYLRSPKAAAKSSGSGIFVREDGATREITRAEWDEKFPGREPVVVTADDGDDGEVYSANITHNLGRMASEAGIYEALWSPEKIPATRAGDIVGILQRGLELLRSDPERFKAFNAPNGWGVYEHFIPFVEKYLAACVENPDATIEVSR